MARTATIAKGTYLGSAIESGVTSGMLQNLGPGVVYAVVASAAPNVLTSPVGSVGFEVQAGHILPFSGLGGTDDVFLGAASDDATVEFAFA